MMVFASHVSYLRERRYTRISTPVFCVTDSSAAVVGPSFDFLFCALLFYTKVRFVMGKLTRRMAVLAKPQM